MKNHFFGKYYKFINNNGESLAIISYTANNVDGLQLLTHNKSYQLDVNEIKVEENKITFNVNQKDITITGSISIKTYTKPKHDIMGCFRYLPIECKHNIYSYLSIINGTLTIDGKEVSFDNGRMYNEGDQGRSFPSKYIWINGIDLDSSFTCSIATIPLLGKTILGFFAYFYVDNKVFKYATYNLAKLKLDNNLITISKHKYKLVIEYVPVIERAHDLKAPTKGKMDRIIREALMTTSKVSLYHKEKLLYQKEYKYTSLEKVNM